MKRTYLWAGLCCVGMLGCGTQAPPAADTEAAKQATEVEAPGVAVPADAPDFAQGEAVAAGEPAKSNGKPRPRLLLKIATEALWNSAQHTVEQATGSVSGPGVPQIEEVIEPPAPEGNPAFGDRDP